MVSTAVFDAYTFKLHKIQNSVCFPRVSLCLTLPNTFFKIEKLGRKRKAKYVTRNVEGFQLCLFYYFHFTETKEK